MKGVLSPDFELGWLVNLLDASMGLARLATVRFVIGAG